MPIVVASPTPVVSLDSAKSFLNISGTASDAELQTFIDAAIALWEGRVGPVSVQTYSEWYDGGRPQIVLRHTPVVSVASITEAFSSALAYTLTAETLDGSAGGDAWGYTLDTETGLITRRATGFVIDFANGRRNVHVTYDAGYSSVPVDIQQGILLLIKHMWATQRGPGSIMGTGGEDYTPGAGFIWPNRVQEIAQAHMVPGIG